MGMCSLGSNLDGRHAVAHLMEVVVSGQRWTGRDGGRYARFTDSGPLSFTKQPLHRGRAYGNIVSTTRALPIRSQL
jgi:hypothetical protein